MIKKILLWLFIAILVLAIGGYAYYRLVIYQPPLISESDRAAITLMPLPAKMELDDGFIDLSRGFDISYPNTENDLIEKSVIRFLEKTKLKCGRDLLHTGGTLLEITCSHNTGDGIPQFGEDESYVLLVKKDRIMLDAPSSYGIIRGLETLFQLVEAADDAFQLPFIEIVDSPRFPWRGMMIDVCRHWIPKEVVLRTIDAMAAVKMNVLHWHLSEDQGFRVESKVFPRLHEIGSNGDYYTQDEIKDIIQFAAERGIRIVPEFDLPGHSKSWQMAYPQLSSVDFPLQFGRMDGELFAPPIDPTKEEVYEFLDQFIEEMAVLFPDQYFHIGGDEVNPKYWNENNHIQEFMNKHEMHDHYDLQAYFNTRMNDLLIKHGKIMLGWDEILHPNLSDDVIVQSWRSHKSLFEVVQQGGTAVLSAGLYLDHVLPAGTHYKVDPWVLEGAVDIDPDTANWKMYDLTMDFAGNEMKSEMVIFDKDPSNIFGFFAFMENRMAFKNGVMDGNELAFSFIGPAGEMDFEATITGDSLNGKMSLGILSFDSWGSKSGGSDKPGTAMPKIEVMKPLSKDEQSRIIGGEACQWSEFVDATNIESRLWPRSAAIAEKLWSPVELTNDVEDMYRRLEVLSHQLTEQGSMHDRQYMQKLHDLIPEEGFDILKTLAEVLEEVKYHGRMGSLMEKENLYLPDFPLDRIVDAVRPESLDAREFNQLVEKFNQEPSNEQIRLALMTQLKLWSKIHEQLAPFIEESAKLKDVENISIELSALSTEAIRKIEQGTSSYSEEELMKKLNFLEAGEHGVIVAVVPGLRTLLIN